MTNIHCVPQAMDYEIRLVVDIYITSCQEESVNSLDYFNMKSEFVPHYFLIIYCNENESEIIEN